MTLPSTHNKNTKISTNIIIAIYWATLIITKIIIEKKLALNFISTSSYHQMISINDLNLPYSSLLYINNQPPLWNIIYRISADIYSNDTIIQYINILSSYISSLFIIRILINLSIGKTTSYLFGGLYILLPETILYQKWGYSSHFTMMVILWNFYELSEISKNGATTRRIITWSASFSILAITRQTYSFIFAIILICYYGRLLKIQKNMIISAIIIATLPAISWQTKNYYLFNSFTMSTWAPRNIFRMASIRLSKDELKILSEGPCGNIILNDPFMDSTNYAARPDVAPYIKSYNNAIANWPSGNAGANSPAYLISSNLYGKAAFCIIRNNPYGYIKSLTQAWALYFTPVSDYAFIKQKHSIVETYDGFINKFIHLQPKEDTPGIKSFSSRALSRSATSILIYAGLIFGTYKFTKDPNSRNQNLLAIAYGGALVFINSLSNLFDSGENMRFRYDVNGIYYIYLVFTLKLATVEIHKIRTKFRSNK